jgi:hypothetical protein
MLTGVFKGLNKINHVQFLVVSFVGLGTRQYFSKSTAIHSKENVRND